MLKRISSIALAIAFVGGMQAAYAHGGTYTGPNGGGSPGYGGPAGGGTTNPGPGGPAGGGGGTTGGGGGGTTGPSGPTGPTGPTRPGGPTGGGGGGGGGAFGGATPGVKKSSGPSFLNWDWWWDLNQERYLNLKNAVRGAEAASDNRDVFLGGTDGGDNVAEVTLQQIRNSVIPALKLAVNDSYYDTRAAAVIALGKVGSGSQADLVEAIKSRFSDEDKRVRESCCLGLGILGSKDEVDLLLKIAKNDSQTAKTLFKRTEILTRTRSWAAVAIGLIGFREGFSPNSPVVQELITLAKADEAQRDLMVGPALALQLIKMDENIPALIDLAKDESLDSYVRAHVVVALGKIGAKAAVPELAKLLRDGDNHVARSAAIALGLVTPHDDDDTVDQLRLQAEKGKERGLKNFAIIALGEIGSERGLATLQKLLLRGQQADRTYAALAMGIYGNKFDSNKEEMGEAILGAFKNAKAEIEVGAYAIALGLLEYEKAVPYLVKELDNAGKLQLKAHVCTALGLLNDKESIPLISKIVEERGDPDLRKAAAISLGLLRDRNAVQLLERVIKESGASKAILGAATVAMGYIGDRSAVPVLTKFVEEPTKYQDVSRAFAAVALGFLGDKDEIPLLSRIHESSNYLSQTEALAELLTIL